MADGRIEIQVILDDDSVAKGVANVDKSLSGIEGSAQKASLSIGKIVTALGLVALARKGIDLLKDSISAATQRIDRFEQFERVMTAVTGSTEEANRAMKLTDDIVTGTGYSLDGAAQAVQNFVTRGATIDEATGYVEAWGDAVAFYGDGSEEQFMNVTDALATMRTKGKVDMQQLNRLFEAGIPAVDMYAQATGRSADEVQDALSNGEISAEDFIDTVSTAMMEGTNGVTNINGAAKDMGSSWGSVFANMKTAVARGVANIITSIDEMLENNGLPTMRDMVAEFGKKFEDVLNKVAEAIPQVIDRIMDVYDKLEPWIPLIAAVVSAVGGMLIAWDAFKRVKGIINGVKGAVVAMNTVLMANPWVLIIGAVIAAAVLIYVYWEPISEFFANLWEKVKEVSIGVWDSIKEAWNTSVEWLKEIWNGISEWFVELWDSIKEVFIGVWDGLVEEWNAFVEMMQAIFEPIIEFFSVIWESVSEVFMSAWEIIFETLSTVWDSIQTAASAAWELIKNVILGPILLLIDLVTGDMESFKSNLSAIWENIKSAASKIWESLKTAVLAIVKGLIDFIKSGWEGLKNVTSTIFSALSDLASSIWEGLKSAISSIVDGIKNTVSDVWESIKSTVTNLAGKAKDGAVKAWNTLKSKTSEAFNKVVDFIKDPLGDIDLFGIGKDIIQGLINGIGSMASAVWDKAKGIATGIGDSIKGALGIHSPSRVLMQLGVYTGEGFEEGISSMIGKVEKSAEDMAKAAMPKKIEPEFRLLNSVKGLNANQAVGNIAAMASAEPVVKRNTNNQMNQPITIVVRPSDVNLEGRPIGEITWEVVEEHIERNKGIHDRFRG